MRIDIWPAWPHISSVMTPRNVCFAWTADSETTARRLKIRRAMLGGPGGNEGGRSTPPSVSDLFSRSHEVSCGGARIHNPHSTSTAVFGESERGLGGARHRDRHVRPRVRLVRSFEVVPDRAELGLDARAVLFQISEHRL